ncbi:hypothetical protein RR46_00858 [Papilio xuthus]|uniref:Uncharacterized protein n=1 Tax=Papilio xuthus TaxID=66420 RepID=A0A0N1ICR7_PAPXU|nr:hypothetical protein RR46_00858 [Papilio xuthus]
MLPSATATVSLWMIPRDTSCETRELLVQKPELSKTSAANQATLEMNRREYPTSTSNNSLSTVNIRSMSFLIVQKSREQPSNTEPLQRVETVNKSVDTSHTIIHQKRNEITNTTPMHNKTHTAVGSSHFVETVYRPVETGIQPTEYLQGRNVSSTCHKQMELNKTVSTYTPRKTQMTNHQKPYIYRPTNNETNCPEEPSLPTHPEPLGLGSPRNKGDDHNSSFQTRQRTVATSGTNNYQDAGSEWERQYQKHRQENEALEQERKRRLQREDNRNRLENRITQGVPKRDSLSKIRKRSEKNSSTNKSDNYESCFQTERHCPSNDNPVSKNSRDVYTSPQRIASRITSRDGYPSNDRQLNNSNIERILSRNSVYDRNPDHERYPSSYDRFSPVYDRLLGNDRYANFERRNSRTIPREFQESYLGQDRLLGPDSRDFQNVSGNVPERLERKELSRRERNKMREEPRKPSKRGLDVAEQVDCECAEVAKKASKGTGKGDAKKSKNSKPKTKTAVLTKVISDIIETSAFQSSQWAADEDAAFEGRNVLMTKDDECSDSDESDDQDEVRIIPTSKNDYRKRCETPLKVECYPKPQCHKSKQSDTRRPKRKTTVYQPTQTPTGPSTYVPTQTSCSRCDLGQRGSCLSRLTEYPSSADIIDPIVEQIVKPEIPEIPSGVESRREETSTKRFPSDSRTREQVYQPRGCVPYKPPPGTTKETCERGSCFPSPCDSEKKCCADTKPEKLPRRKDSDRRVTVNSKVKTIEPPSPCPTEPIIKKCEEETTQKTRVIEVKPKESIKSISQECGCTGAPPTAQRSVSREKHKKKVDKSSSAHRVKKPHTDDCKPKTKPIPTLKPKPSCDKPSKHNIKNLSDTKKISTDRRRRRDEVRAKINTSLSDTQTSRARLRSSSNDSRMRPPSRQTSKTRNKSAPCNYRKPENESNIKSNTKTVPSKETTPTNKPSEDKMPNKAKSDPCEPKVCTDARKISATTRDVAVDIRCPICTCATQCHGTRCYRSTDIINPNLKVEKEEVESPDNSLDDDALFSDYTSEEITDTTLQSRTVCSRVAIEYCDKVTKIKHPCKTCCKSIEKIRRIKKVNKATCTKSRRLKDVGTITKACKSDRIQRRRICKRDRGICTEGKLVTFKSCTQIIPPCK